MSDIVLDLGVSGRYRLIRVNNGKVVQDTGWFKNLITNLGMNYLGDGTQYLGFCRVGSSNVTPAFGDVSLGAQIAAAGTPSFNDRIETGSRYAVTSRTYTFTAGSAAGNIAEIGVSGSSTGNNLFSRALVLDAFGNPTTITVLSDEDLVVIYELWIKQPTGDIDATVSGTTIKIRASLVNTLNSPRGWAAQSNTNGVPLIAQSSNSAHALHSGAIGAITGEPTGTPQYVTGSSISFDAYTPGTFTRVSNLRWLPAQAVGTWQSASFSLGATFWQASFSPALTKTNVQSLTLKIRSTWSRDSGPTP